MASAWQITMTLFVEPVVSPSGETYSRSTVSRFENGLCPSRLPPCVSLDGQHCSTQCVPAAAGLTHTHARALTLYLLVTYAGSMSLSVCECVYTHPHAHTHTHTRRHRPSNTREDRGHRQAPAESGDRAPGVLSTQAKPNGTKPRTLTRLN